jgi:hypothetical protein
MEIMYAYMIGIKVIIVCNNHKLAMSPWLSTHGYMFNKLEDAIEDINNGH